MLGISSLNPNTNSNTSTIKRQKDQINTEQLEKVTKVAENSIQYSSSPTKKIGCILSQTPPA